MKVLTLLVLASVLGMSSGVALADPPAVNKVTSTKAATTKAQGTIAAAPDKISQQDKMRLCAKQATGKKGAERKAFMKTCLSSKKA